MNEACRSRYSGGAQVNKCSLKIVQDSLVDIDVISEHFGYKRSRYSV